MSDLLHLQFQLTVIRGDTATVPGTSEVEEDKELDIQLGDFLGIVKVTLGNPVDGSGHPIPQSLVIPAPPYNGMFFMECQNPVHLNVNSQGNQVVNSVFISMAAVITATITNDIIPAGEAVVQPVEIRYLLAKLAS